MTTISKIDGIAIADIAKIDGIAIGSIAKIDGLSIPTDPAILWVGGARAQALFTDGNPWSYFRNHAGNATDSGAVVVGAGAPISQDTLDGLERGFAVFDVDNIAYPNNAKHTFSFQGHVDGFTSGCTVNVYSGTVLSDSDVDKLDFGNNKPPATLYSSTPITITDDGGYSAGEFVLNAAGLAALRTARTNNTSFVLCFLTSADVDDSEPTPDGAGNRYYMVLISNELVINY